MKGKWLALVIIYALAVTVRIYPLFVTTLPYNVDSLTDSRASQYIAHHGSLNYPPGVTYNNYHTPATPLFNALSGAISQLTGVDVLSFLPYIFPFITSISVLGWYLFTKKLTKREDMALITASFLAISGNFVLATASVWKEAVGLAIMPFALYTYRKRNPVSIFLLAILPLTHHYVALITYLMVSYFEIYNFYEKYKEHKIFTYMDYIWPTSIAALWAYMGIYYSIRHFDRLSSLSPSGDLWLFISLFTLLSLVSFRTFNMTYKKGRIGLIISIMLIPLIFYTLYYFFPIFPHTMKFNQTTFIFTLGYVILLPIISIGIYILLSTKYSNKKEFIGILFAPLHMMSFFIFRGFDLMSYTSLGRTAPFIDPASNISLSTATQRFKRRLITYTLIFIILSTTTPIAYHTAEAFGGYTFVYPHQIHAAEWIKENFDGENISTDGFLGLIAKDRYDINGSRNLPYALQQNIEPLQDLWLVGSYWEDGAQMVPMAPIKVNVTGILEENSVVFSSGRTFVVLNNTS